MLLFLRSVCLVPIIALLLTSATRGAVYDYAAGDGSARRLRLNMPDDLAVVRGILIWGNGASSDGRNLATDPELVAFARSIGFCVLATGYWGNFSDAAQSELNLFTTGIAQLAVQSTHPELVHAPWLPIGHSNGGQMSYGLNALRPDRVIAMVVSKGAYYVTARPVAAALRTPGLLVAGETDASYRRSSIRDLFEGNRPRGALWAWVEEEATDHSEGNSAQLIRPFIAECVRLRLPAEADPREGPVSLRDVPEESGWLVESGTDKAGFARVYAYADYPGDQRAAGWLPTERLARLFCAFASYRKATAESVLASVGMVVARDVGLTYRVGRPTGDWTSIEFYEGATAIARFTPADPDLVTRQPAGRSGYLCFHALVTYADGTQRATMPRRVFVPPPAGPVFDASPSNLAVDAGSAATFTASARRENGESATAFGWTCDGVDVAGATNHDLRVAAATPAQTGIYMARCDENGSAPAVLGIVISSKLAGAAREVGSDITPVPGGYTYDQVLLEGAAAAVTADPGQITRISFVDLSDDIVQVEFSGAGTLSLVIEGATSPATPINYHQPDVAYVKGHARIVIASADATTHVSVFSVGPLTALNPALFKPGVHYDGMADIASIAILSPSGRFGSLRTANASYLATRGLTGVYAPGVWFTGPVRLGDLSAADTATPVIVLGAAVDACIAGGDLSQLNSRAVLTSGVGQLRFVDGMTSHGILQSAQPNQATLQQDGLDVTALLIAARR